MTVDTEQIPKGMLEGKVALITGASQGLGIEVARKYLRAGASAAICARDKILLERARADLQSQAWSGQKVIAVKADVSQGDDVENLVDAVIGEFSRIDILVNNAGVGGPLGIVEGNDWREWTRTIEINLYGSVLTCRAVLPHFKKQGAGKIIQLSGGGATRAMPQASAYAASKAAVVRFMETLAAEVRDMGIDVNAIAPGPLDTRLLDDALAAGPDTIGQETYDAALKTKESGGATMGKAADLAVFLGSEMSNGISGKLISALWDPWSSLPDYLDDLQSSDIYTLGRIVPKDRGKTWGTDT